MTTHTENIESLSYPDFVAFIGQDNCPPGGFATLEEWREWTNLGSSSHVLDLACSTGFASRYLAARTGCSGQGIDISPAAVARATAMTMDAGLDQSLEFVPGDACNTPFEDNAFTHVLGGCNFAFITEREDALREMRRVLAPEGLLCTASFEYVEPPPEALLDEVRSAVGFRPQRHWTASFWSEFFTAEFRLVRETFKKLAQSKTELLRRQVEHFIQRHSRTLRDADANTRHRCEERLFKIREPLNRQRHYQGFRVAVWAPRA